MRLVIQTECKSNSKNEDRHNGNRQRKYSRSQTDVRIGEVLDLLPPHIDRSSYRFIYSDRIAHSLF